MRYRFFLLATLCAVAFGIRAELPPSAYKERQDKAPEALVIKVRTVKSRATWQSMFKRTEFTIDAAVEKVDRSATKLTPGAIIKIVYVRNEHDRQIVGPSEIPELEEGQVCPAYLARNGDVYSPVAGGYSFETVR